MNQIVNCVVPVSGGKDSQTCLALAIEHFGNDIVGAKQLLEFSKDCKTIELSGSVITVERLEQAIADYEQLFGNTETLELETLRDCDTSPNCKKFDERVK